MENLLNTYGIPRVYEDLGQVTCDPFSAKMRKLFEICIEKTLFLVYFCIKKGSFWNEIKRHTSKNG